MRKHWKKGIAVCLSLALAAGIAGCGEETDVQETGGTPAETEAAEAGKEKDVSEAETGETAGESAEEPAASTEGQAAGHIEEELLDNLAVDAEVKNPSQEAYAEYDAKIREWGRDYTDKMKQLFLEGENVSVQEDLEGIWAILGENGSAVVSPGALDYRTGEYDENYADLFFAGFGAVLEDRKEELPEIDAGDRRRAERDTEKIAEALEIPVGEEPVMCCALDGAMLDVLYGKIQGGGQEETRDYSGDEGVLIVQYPLVFQGESVARERSGYGYLESGSYLTAVFRPDGEVLAFSCGPQYIAGEAETKPVEVLNAEAVLQMLKKEYEERDTEARATVKTIEFCYAPVIRSEKDLEVKECGMVPAWEIYAVSEMTEESGAVQTEVFRFHALTGEKLEPYQTNQ